jgi:hypothetical protein
MIKPKFGTKHHTEITEDTIHRARVIERKRQVLLQQLDNELPEIYSYPLELYKGKSKREKIWNKVVRLLKELLP